MRRPKFGLVCFVLAVSAAMGTVVGSAPPAGAATIVPVLSAPVTSNTYTSPSVSIAYTLPQAPLAGSVRLVFVGSVTVTLTMDNATSASFTLATDNVLASPHVVSSTPTTSIPDGTYDVTLVYQNAAADPAASVTAVNVAIAPPTTTTTTPPTTTTTTPPTTTTTTTTTAPTSTTLSTTTTSVTTTTIASGATTEPSSTTTTVDVLAANSTAAGGVNATGLAATGSGLPVPLVFLGLGLLCLGSGLFVAARRRSR